MTVGDERQTTSVAIDTACAAGDAGAVAVVSVAVAVGRLRWIY